MKEIQQVFVVFYSDFQANLHPQRCRVIFNKLRPDTNCSALELHLIEPELTLITRKFAETILTSYFSEAATSCSLTLHMAWEILSTLHTLNDFPPKQI